MGKLNYGKLAWFCALLGAVTSMALAATTFTTLHSFAGPDGANPYAGQVQATDGNFYGTTSSDGANGNGTVFKITPGGSLTTLYNFCSRTNCADGAAPVTGLIQAADGNFYGTTQSGGTANWGTVFKITPGGRLTPLHSFDLADGAAPYGTLVQGADGNFYGTTNGGGANSAGTVFKITPGGSLTTLYNFCSQGGCVDGQYPVAGLIQAPDGNFYGTTYAGGANGACLDGCGTVFKITPAGALATLYSFCSQSGCTDGNYPQHGTLILGADGKFYGTTTGGGANGGGGTVFNIAPGGPLTTLYSFCSQGGENCTDGNQPYSMIQGSDGNFYGTTQYGGTGVYYGEVFQVTPGGKLTTLHSFDLTDGKYPYALIQGTDGKFYGTTYFGGAGSNGTVFSLSVGLGPFVETLPASGKTGTAVNILGTNLTGATSVTFNGTAAAFTVVSRNLITTTVPSGATSGRVQILGSRGALRSNVPFRVLP